MTLNSLNAITPIDGRYYQKTVVLQEFFSEYALIKYRVQVEIEYFISLCNSNIEGLSGFPTNKYKSLREIYISFNENDAKRIKDIEKTTNHDVKAVEYFLKEKFDELNIQKFKEFIHFGLTSQDINNTAIPYSIKEAIREVLLPSILEVINIMELKSNEWKDTPLLARTHGQAASPTKMGKEINVFVERIHKQLELLKSIPFTACCTIFPCI